MLLCAVEGTESNNYRSEDSYSVYMCGVFACDSFYNWVLIETPITQIKWGCVVRNASRTHVNEPMRETQDVKITIWKVKGAKQIVSQRCSRPHTIEWKFQQVQW